MLCRSVVVKCCREVEGHRPFHRHRPFYRRLRSQRPGEFHQPRRRDRWDGVEKIVKKWDGMGWMSRVLLRYAQVSHQTVTKFTFAPSLLSLTQNLFNCHRLKLKLFDFEIISIFCLLSFTALYVLRIVICS